MRVRSRTSAFSPVEVAVSLALAAVLGALLVQQTHRPAASRPAEAPRAQEPAEPPIRVAAAISLREALSAVAEDFETRTGIRVEPTFGSSGQLLTQIRNGAPLDAFISAAHEQVDALERENLAAPGSRRVLARNELALIAPAKGGVTLSGIEDLARIEVRRLAIGQPETVPAGQYAWQVLASLRIETALSERLVYGANVRQVLDYVARGEVSAGIAYVTDARAAGEAVRVVAVARPAWHEPIEYPAVVLRASPRSAAARRLLDHAASPAGQAVFARFGFAPGEAASEPALRTPRTAAETPSTNQTAAQP